ncbi:MAG TPA: NnrU family protein [Gemmataceae bacterium]|nr:NnrU family protein [Gemmataceae bacterium]
MKDTAMPTKVIAVVAYVIGIAGAAIYFAFVLGVGTGFLPRPDPVDGPLPWLIDLGWLMLFALQHSGMARRAFKRWWTSVIPATLERAIYVGCSGIAIVILTIGWQPLPGEPIWQGPVWIVGISLTAAAGIGICSAWFDHARFFGLQQAWTGKLDTWGPLRIEGPYRYVRHPLMVGLLIAIWAQPTMPTELLLLNAGISAYIFIAIQLEERDMIRQFGVAYRRYRRRVPALIPWRRWP